MSVDPDVTPEPPRTLLRTLAARGHRQGKALANAWGLSVLALAAVALLDPPGLVPVLDFALRALAGTAPYILFAVLVLAGLRATGADALAARAFQGSQTRMIVMAALIGGLAPFCSCEVIPFIAGLLALGAPLSAVMAFWLSSPLIDPPTLLITAGALGWPFAIGKMLAAVGLGLLGGFAVRLIVAGGGLAGPVTRAPRRRGCGGTRDAARPVWQFWAETERRSRFWTDLRDNGLFLVKWLSLAYVLEAVLVRYLPADLIAQMVGGSGILPVILAAVLGMPAYLNGYVAPAMLAGLIEQGMSPGAAMAFIVAGAVSSVPAMAAVWALVQPRVFVLYLGLGLGGAILAGVLFRLV